MLPDIIISVGRSGLGLVESTNDNIMGIVLNGVAVANKLVLDTPYSIYSTADAEALGIEESGVNAKAWHQINEFYNEVGSKVKLWIIVTDNDKMSDAVLGTTNAVRGLVENANGEISIIGAVEGKAQGVTIVDGLNSDVMDAVNAGQILAVEYQSKLLPFSLLFAGIGFSGDADVVPDLHSMTKHRCSVVLATSTPSKGASIGQALGRLALIPVQRKISRVKSGALSNTVGYLLDGVSVDNKSDLGTLHDKGYIIYRKFPRKTGYFYNGDSTCTSLTDDLNTISRNRVIDKVIKIAYKTYVEELDDDVPVTKQGTLEGGVIGYLKTKIETQVNSNMVNEISDFNAFISPDQNILSGLPLEIELNVTPMAYLDPIKVKIGFVNPYLNS